MVIVDVNDLKVNISLRENCAKPRLMRGKEGRWVRAAIAAAISGGLELR
jgi:hypothetical protein